MSQKAICMLHPIISLASMFTQLKSICTDPQLFNKRVIADDLALYAAEGIDLSNCDLETPSELSATLDLLSGRNPAGILPLLSTCSAVRGASDDSDFIDGIYEDWEIPRGTLKRAKDQLIKQRPGKARIILPPQTCLRTRVAVHPRPLCTSCDIYRRRVGAAKHRQH